MKEGEMMDKKDEHLQSVNSEAEGEQTSNNQEKMMDYSATFPEESIRRKRADTRYDSNKKIVKEVFDWGKSIIIAVVVVFIFRQFLFSPFIVDGRSMEPSFETNERVIVNLLIYRFGEPKFGDVVVFDVPEQNRRFIKRIIGVPGDKISVEGDQLYINDQLVTEPYLTAAIRDSMEHGETYNGVGGRFDFPNDSIIDNVVPEGKYFVLGDNRSDSTDSRIIGYVNKEELIGRADVIFWPMDKVQFVKHYN